MRWNRLEYKNGMSHVVSDDLLHPIKEAMERATPSGVLERVGSVHEVCLELGGACLMGRPTEEISFCDLTIRIPSEDFAMLVDRWKDKPASTSLGREFYRLTSWPWQCLVVDPRQRDLFLEVFGAHVDLAEHRATEFWADRKSPQEVARAYNESVGVVIPYGPDKIARFRS